MIRTAIVLLLIGLLLIGLVVPRDHTWGAEQHARVADKNDTLRVASLSIFPEKWNKAGNRVKIERMVRDAATQGAELVITPEGVLEGYVVNEVIDAQNAQAKAKLTRRFAEVAEPVDGPHLRALAALADELDIHLIVGFLEADGQRTFNTAALFDPAGQLLGKYRKTHFAQGYTVNPPGYTAGRNYPVFDIGMVNIGIMICFDRQPPEPARQLALGGAEIIACPSYGGYGAWNTRLMQVRAYENDAYVVFTHPEQSLIIDRSGEILREGGKDQIMIQDIDAGDLDKTRASFTNRRPETYDRLREPPGL